LWKKSGHYSLWKEYGKPVRRLAQGKEAQWKTQQDKMKSFRSPSPSASIADAEVNSSKSEVDSDVNRIKVNQSLPM
jgi:hypothetical protein